MPAATPLKEGVRERHGTAETLGPRRLCRRCDPSQFTFETTAEVKELSEVLRQARAVEAIQFGIGIQREGCNLFALGPPGIGKHTTGLRGITNLLRESDSRAGVAY